MFSVVDNLESLKLVSRGKVTGVGLKSAAAAKKKVIGRATIRILLLFHFHRTLRIISKASRPSEGEIIYLGILALRTPKNYESMFWEPVPFNSRTVFFFDENIKSAQRAYTPHTTTTRALTHTHIYYFTARLLI